MTRKTVNSAGVSCLAFSIRRSKHSVKWIRECKYGQDVEHFVLYLCTKLTAQQSKENDLDELSSLGHFLKGSSATLGLKKVMKSCEKIQHFGHKKDETGQHDKPADFCLDAIKTELPKLRKDYDDAEKALRKFYGEES